MRPLRRRLLFVSLLVLSVASARAQAGGSPQAIVIDHAEVGCVQAEKFVKIEARLDPAAAVARARVYFRAAGTPSWYSVEMKRVEGGFEGVLPRPMKTTPRINYYLEAASSSFAENRTAEYAPEVVAAGQTCRKMAASVGAAGALLVLGPGGAPAIPAGFSGVGLASAGATTTAAGSATSGGGIGSKALIIGGAVVAGGVAVAVSAGGSDTTHGRQILLSETVTNVQSRVGNVFRTFRAPGPGTLDASGDWTDGGKNIDIYIADASCVSFHECQFLAQSATSGKPERIAAFQISAAGTFNLFIVNESDGVEPTVRVEVGFTP